MYSCTWNEWSICQCCSKCKCWFSVCNTITYSCGKLNLKTQQQQPVSALRSPLIEMFFTLICPRPKPAGLSVNRRKAYVEDNNHSGTQKTINKAALSRISTNELSLARISWKIFILFTCHNWTDRQSNRLRNFSQFVQDETINAVQERSLSAFLFGHIVLMLLSGASTRGLIDFFH